MTEAITMTYFCIAFWTQNDLKTFDTVCTEEKMAPDRNLSLNTSSLVFKIFHLILYSVFHKQQPFVVYTIFTKLILNVGIDRGIQDIDMSFLYFPV